MLYNIYGGMPMTTGQLLKKLREEKGWSKNHYAKLRHITHKEIINYENDKVHPKPERLQHLLKSYRLTIEQFVKMLDED